MSANANSNPSTQKGGTLGTQCNCSMEFQVVSNDTHSDNCHLWVNSAFWQYAEKWDGARGCLVPAPLSTYDMEDDIDSYDASLVGALGAEAEALALMADGILPDDLGWLRLNDGSWADTVQRLTYRVIRDDKGQDCWVEERWDDSPSPAATLDPADCKCIPERTYFCAPCDVIRDRKTDAWRWQSLADKNTDPYSNVWSRCHHVLNPVALPGGERTSAYRLRASAMRSHTPTTTPDLGVYAANGWRPASPALVIPWDDYGLPSCSLESAAKSIKLAYAALESGDEVEVGCVGGHGRTGTILACLVLCADPEMLGPSAVAWVRHEHCKNAVESREQEWFIRWFRAWLRNELPAFTEERPPSWTTTVFASAAAPIASGQNLVPTTGGKFTYVTNPTPNLPSAGLNSISKLLAGATAEAAAHPKGGLTTTTPEATANARRRAAKRKARQSRIRRQQSQHHVRNRDLVPQGRR